MMLRNVILLVTDQKMQEPLLGSPLLDKLGLANRELLVAVADRFQDQVDVSQIEEAFENPTSGCIFRVSEGIFHNEGGINDDANSDDDWYDLGPETDDEWEAALAKKLYEASSNGISKGGLKRLEKLIREHCSHIRIRLNGGEPARVPSLHIRTLPNAKPIRTKPRVYPPEKRKNMKNTLINY